MRALPLMLSWGRYKAKCSIGEIVLGPTAGAIANAVAAAIGAPILQLPITPERVLGALDGSAPVTKLLGNRYLNA